jgi:LAO/AO transport system kinase
VDVVNSAHTTVIVVIPGMGDDIQAIKAGILEVGDIFVINKADREGADKTEGNLRFMIDMDQRKYEGGKWRPPVLKVQAIFDKGVEGILKKIEEHRESIVDTCGELHFRKRKVREELAGMVKNRLIEDVIKKLTETGEFDRAVESIVKGKMDPYTACDNLVLSKLYFSNE